MIGLKERDAKQDPAEKDVHPFYYRFFLILSSGIFVLGLFLDLTLNFSLAPDWFFPVLIATQLLQILLFSRGVEARVLVPVNITVILVLMQFMIVQLPFMFHIMVYWLGIIPIMLAVIVPARQIGLWGAIVAVMIAGNGYYFSKTAGTYQLEMVPGNFAVAGLFFFSAVFTASFFFKYLQEKNSRKLKEQNDQLLSLKQEIEQQHAMLHRQHGQIQQQRNKLESYIKILIQFSQDRSVIEGDLPAAIRNICQEVNINLGVTRVSYWDYEYDHDSIRAKYFYPEIYPTGVILPLAQYPVYALALKNKIVIAAADATTHPHTREFSESYLKPMEIASMLDAPVIVNGHLIGIICCEQMVESKHWDEADILFVSALCDILTITVKAAENNAYIQEARVANQALREKQDEIETINSELKQMNDTLEERVRIRTNELEMQNKALAEYAFINSHLLRGPLSSILGLVNLVSHSELSAKEGEIVAHLRTACHDLDGVIQSINRALDGGRMVSRATIEELKEEIRRSTIRASSK